MNQLRPNTVMESNKHTDANHFLVTVIFECGRTVCDPVSLSVTSGDTVQWTCRKGDLALDFKHQTPFTSSQVWRAPFGQVTPMAIVQPGLPGGTVYRPVTISIDGTVVAESLGDIIVREA